MVRSQEVMIIPVRREESRMVAQPWNFPVGRPRTRKFAIM
jgi:hypothetical protein